MNGRDEALRGVPRFSLCLPACGREIAVEVLLLKPGVHVSIYGGDAPHIGAVAIIDPAGSLMVNEFPGHRDGVICRHWADRFNAERFHPAVIECGIHYDGITREGIQEVVSVTDDMLEVVVQRIASVLIEPNQS